MKSEDTTGGIRRNLELRGDAPPAVQEAKE